MVKYLKALEMFEIIIPNSLFQTHGKIFKNSPMNSGMLPRLVCLLNIYVYTLLIIEHFKLIYGY
jgi:sorbitol-specific phosphotransferase system component IIC